MIGVMTVERPPLDLDEVRRYARILGRDALTDQLLTECITEAEQMLCYKVCYAELPVHAEGDSLNIGGIITDSRLLQKALCECGSAVLFAATVGADFDRLIRRYSRISPAKALIFQALGAERAEALCDAFERRFSSEHNCALKKRVSPGYGDIPLSMQTDIFALLDCPRKIGLTLNESLLMSPSKSVTAFAGITHDSQGEEI